MEIQFIQSHNEAKDQHHKVPHETRPETDDIHNLRRRQIKTGEKTVIRGYAMEQYFKFADQL